MERGRRAAARPRGGRHAVGGDGRVLRPQHARAAGAHRARPTSCAPRSSTRATRPCATATATRTSRAPGRRSTWCSGPRASPAPAPGTRCADEALGERVRERTVADMIESARAAGAPVARRDGVTTVEVVAGITTTLGGLRIDGDARVAAGRVCRGRRRGRDRDRRVRKRPRCGARVRADRCRLRARRIGCATRAARLRQLRPADPRHRGGAAAGRSRQPPARARRRARAGRGRAAGVARRARGLRVGDRAAHADLPHRRRGRRRARAGARRGARGRCDADGRRPAPGGASGATCG